MATLRDLTRMCPATQQPYSQVCAAHGCTINTTAAQELWVPLTSVSWSGHIQ